MQNFESRVDLSLAEQPDLSDIPAFYLQSGGGFWIAVDDNDDVVGTIGLIKQDRNGILKKFFVSPAYRGRAFGVSEGLYCALLRHAGESGVARIVLDTPAVCTRAHSFYRKKGFRQITKAELPFAYDYPDRNSLLFFKTL